MTREKEGRGEKVTREGKVSEGGGVFAFLYWMDIQYLCRCRCHSSLNHFRSRKVYRKQGTRLVFQFGSQVKTLCLYL